MYSCEAIKMKPPLFPPYTKLDYNSLQSDALNSPTFRQPFAQIAFDDVLHSNKK